MIPFLCAVTQYLTGQHVELVPHRTTADLKLITERTLARWLVSLGPTFSHVGRMPISLLPPVLLNRFLRIHGFGSRTIFITAENLQHPAWVGVGDLIRRSSLPRLTSWPKEIDQEGERLPYWYSHVDWPELRDLGPRVYPRYGQLLNLETLMQPLSFNEAKIDSVAVMVSHSKFPRNKVLDQISNRYRLDVPTTVDRDLPKFQFFNRYKYAFAGENSIGIGYCTEKVPEAWQAGCFPMGVFSSPHSDWNEDVLGLYQHSMAALEQPLLKKRPSLNDVVAYVKAQL